LSKQFEGHKRLTMNLRSKPTFFLFLASAFHSATAETKLVLAEEKGVSDSWVFQFEDDVDTGAAKALYTDKIEGITVGKPWDVINGFPVEGPIDAIQNLLDEFGEGIKSVEQNAEVTVNIEWGPDRVDERDLPLDNQPLNVIGVDDAAGVNAYIIDTGVRITHDEFEGRAIWGTNTADGTNTDCNGHGTHVAGSVAGKTYGVARKANIIAVKVLNCSGSGTWGGVIEGVNWAYNHARVRDAKATANLSLGGGKYQALNNAVKNLHNSGVFTVVAAGNSNANACNYSPASEPAVLSVGATMSTDGRASFSNWGSCLDIFAPGVYIKSAWVGSDSATKTISGTSMASPHVCGGAALVLSTGVSSPVAVESFLKSTATPNKVTNPGTGSPNLLLFVGKEGTDPPTMAPTRATKAPTPDEPCEEDPQDHFCLSPDIVGGGPLKCGLLALLKRKVRQNACSSSATCEGYGSAADVCFETCEEFKRYQFYKNTYTCKSLSKKDAEKKKIHCQNTDNISGARVCFAACGTCPGDFKESC